LRRVLELGLKQGVVVPLRQNGQPIGAISVWGLEDEPFPAQQVALFETFADQAVIAIENARLVSELQAKTREQAETLEEQAATNHILEIISQSPTDVQPVLDAICETALRVCDAYDAQLGLMEGDRVRFAAHVGPIGSPESLSGADVISV